jgi:hypothetical protein
MTSVLHDVRCGRRTWRAQPSVAALDVLTLLLGTGVHVVASGLARALLLRPLPAVDSAGRFVSSQLYGVSAEQPWVLLLAGAITLAIGVASATGPAVRALRTAPADGVRE